MTLAEQIAAPVKPLADRIAALGLFLLKLAGWQFRYDRDEKIYAAVAPTIIVPKENTNAD